MGESMYTRGDYLEQNPTWHTEDSSWKASKVLEILAANDVHPRTFCEIGCGAGEILVHLHDALPPTTSFVGYEISPQAYALAQPRGRERLAFRLADLLAEDDQWFDLVLAADVFEHVEDYLGFLRALRQRAEWKVFHIPLDLSVLSLARRTPILRERDEVGHLHYFFKDTALATLDSAGYEVVDWRYTPASFELPGRQASRRSAITRLARRVIAARDKDLAARLLGGWSLLVLAR